MVGRILPYSAAVVLSVVYFQIAQIMVSVLPVPAKLAISALRFACWWLSRYCHLCSSTIRCRCSRGPRATTTIALTTRVADSSRRCCSPGAACSRPVLGRGVCGALIAGPGFGPSVDVVHILAFALLGTFVIGARGYGLLSLDRLRAMLVCNAIALTVVVVAGVPLIEAYGAEGAAIAMVAAELTLALCYEWSLSLGRPRVRLRPSFVARTAAAMVCGRLRDRPWRGSPLAVIGWPFTWRRCLR